jgi:hypothetical protein
MQIGAAALSPIVAVVGGWIAWQQVRINRNKLKLDRFDRRFEVHEAAMTFAASIVADGDVTVAAFTDFSVKSRGARFLLNEEIADYMKELSTTAIKLRGVLRSLKNPSITDDQRAQYADRIGEITKWFEQQLDVIPERFAPFLSVRDI